MRTLFVAAVAVLVVIGIDGWLCFRTLTPGALPVRGLKTSLVTPSPTWAPTDMRIDGGLVPTW